MTRVGEGHLVRHYQGLSGGRDAAPLDIAQDHALHLLHNSRLLNRGLVFKGGSALRKFRARACRTCWSRRRPNGAKSSETCTADASISLASSQIRSSGRPTRQQQATFESVAQLPQ